MSFLKAEWRKLAFINYAIDPAQLQEFLPFGTELDLWEGKCYVSLIGFRFVNTRLLGIKVPFHVNFEEVNLRFYVKRLVNNEWRRGVVFVKEIVPKAAITFVANTFYNEKYETRRMQYQWQEDKDYRTVEYQWKVNSDWQSIRVTAEKNALDIEKGSEIEFITEHYWGYAKVNDYQTNEYQVTHPKWQHYNVTDYKLTVDFALIYGEKFKYLNEYSPTSVMLAEGSAITIENKYVIKRSS